MDGHEKKRYIFFVYISILGIICYLLVRPFFSAILAGALLSYLLYPVYVYLQRILRRDGIAAMLIIATVCFLILLPSIFLVEHLASESIVFYAYWEQLLIKGIPCTDGVGCQIVHSVNTILSDPLIANFMNVLVQQVSSLVVTSVSGAAVQSLYFLFDVLVAMFVAYYCFVEGNELAGTLHKIFPHHETIKQQIASQLRRISSVIFIGFFAIALLEGLLGYIAFALVGSPIPLFWALIIAFTALVPFISAATIMIPLIVYFIIAGNVMAAVIFAVFAALLFYVDTFLPSILVGNTIHIHPLAIFLGLLGGVQLLGVVGIVLGPFILSFSLLLLKHSLTR